MGNPVRIAGTGSYVPENVVTNDEIVKAIGEKDAAWIERLLGIKTRRYLAQIDLEAGEALPCPLTELDMSEFAARRAIKDAKLLPEDIDYIMLVTCTPDVPHFCQEAIGLHKRLELPDSVNAIQIDSGCGGAMQLLALADEILANGKERNILVVASNCASKFVSKKLYVDSRAWLSMYLFGDGAGAFVMTNRLNGGSFRVLHSIVGTDGAKPLVTFNGGGCSYPFNKAEHTDFVYMVDGEGVRDSFGPTMHKAITRLRAKHDFELKDVSRFYLHQANLRLLQKFCQSVDVPMEKVAVMVDRGGNTSAAAIPMMFAEDKQNGLLKSGDRVLMAAIGAGIHYGAALVEV